MQVEINKQVWQALKKITEEADINLLDGERVALRCEELGHTEAAAWIRGNRRAYALGIFKGFRCKSLRKKQTGEC